MTETIEQLRTRARESIADDLRLDYARPFQDRPNDRAHTIALFDELCRRGDRGACRTAPQLRHDAPDSTFDAVLAQCRAGDTLSCRVLPADSRWWRFPDAPGATSRNPACVAILNPACNVTQLRAECANEFPDACEELALRESTPDAPSMSARWQTLSVAGCRNGVVRECYAPDSQLGTFPVLEQLCNIDQSCGGLGFYYERAGELMLGRDAYERSCQYAKFNLPSCLHVAANYFSGKYPEPVVGRGQALLDYACPQLGKRSDVVRRTPICAKAKSLAP